jgi:exopolyphosphatase/pppGpp-phosphohydrolase
MTTTAEQDAFREKVLQLRQTELGIAFYKYSELLRNATEVEMRTEQYDPRRKQAFEMHNEALQKLLDKLFEIEGITDGDSKPV